MMLKKTATGMELVIKICKWNTNFPLGSFHRENGTTFSGILFVLEKIQWNEPKSHVSFTSQPECLEVFGTCKWKTLTVSLTNTKCLLLLKYG